ncbi:3-dehydroquinate synthase [Prosthecochloris sp. GSB1]|uniref:3-dehydroquinate synthase n=1 Tax=Prosthecochloris sp. GSB1 TaxID=281093 RepID=UPI000B8C78A5|nr:3-dehydroquinate synthase [Prosthecochloris sp. GSB1]ASQ90150.1 3-dehydroquinate synthase [Prosthecochloris sp. GSB1]
MSNIIVGTPVMADIGKRFREHGLPKKTVVLFDENTRRLFGDDILETLRQAEFSVVELVIPARETSKSFRTAFRLYGEMIDAGIDRSWNLLAVGGGVVGDLGGYIAASYYRGIPVVQFPTTLLAMTDSSIGGKVAINHPQGKNLIGFFHMPEMVLIDPSYLKTLPRREMYAGMAEVVKYGFIADRNFLDYVDSHFMDIVEVRDPYTAEAVRRSAAVKADVVAKDFLEKSGLRATLNFGHTFAHGFEKLAGYRHIRHGEAVTIGMVCALHLSRLFGKIGDEDLLRGIGVLSKFRFPRNLLKKRFLEQPSADILESMHSDKKKVDKTLRFVLLEQLGKAYLHDEPIADELVVESIEHAKETLKKKY